MLSVVLTAALLAPARAPDPEGLLLGAVLNEGLAVPGGPRVKLPQPFMSAGLTPAQKKAVLTRFVDTEGRRFTDTTLLGAPHFFKERSIGKGKQPGHFISVAFVAFGKMEDVEKKNLLDELLGLKKGGKKPILLEEKDLATRKVVLLPRTVIDDRYAVLDATLIDRVQLTGVMHNQTWKTKGQLTAVAVLDDRFLNDPDYPNRYQVIDPPPPGPKTPYSGFGGYVRVTELEDPRGALFIEMHFLYHEPQAWFNGKSILVPKLRIGVKDNVLTMRRSLKGVPKAGRPGPRR